MTALESALAKAQGEAAVLREAVIAAKKMVGPTAVFHRALASAPLAAAAARVLRAAKAARCFMVHGAAPAPGITEATVWLYLDEVVDSVDALLALEAK